MEGFLRNLALPLFAGALLTVGGCAASNPGVPGEPDVVDFPITGTVFTIVFENHGVDAVINPRNPTFVDLAERYGFAAAYLSNTHPSLPNYIQMVSGQDYGVGDDADPASHPLPGNENLADQLDAGGITWRAYMEGMGEPCGVTSSGEYVAKHNPFVYFTSLTDDRARCEEHVVDFDANFAEDLASNRYQYMWITPNQCHDMHDCDTEVADAWLASVIPEIMASPGYREGGAIFILWDEGDADATYAWSVVFGRPQNMPMILISENLVSPGFVSNTTYGHDSYLATIEDTFGLPRLPTTVGSTPMADFFYEDPWGRLGGPGVTSSPSSTTVDTSTSTSGRTLGI